MVTLCFPGSNFGRWSDPYLMQEPKKISPYDHYKSGGHGSPINGVPSLIKWSYYFTLLISGFWGSIFHRIRCTKSLYLDVPTFSYEKKVIGSVVVISPLLKKMGYVECVTTTTDPHWLVVSTHLKNISQNGFIFPKVSGENIKNIWNHDLANLLPALPDPGTSKYINNSSIKHGRNTPCNLDAWIHIQAPFAGDFFWGEKKWGIVKTATPSKRG